MDKIEKYFLILSIFVVIYYNTSNIMFFVISGKDYFKKKKRLNSIKRALVKKRPDAEFKIVDSFDIDNDLKYLESLLETVGLFENKSIILFINILENKEIKKFFFNNIEKFKDSDNAFIFSEELLTKIEIDKIKKFSNIMENYINDIDKKFNLFSLTNFLLNRDKRNLWIMYNQALINENSESIYNIFLWQIKVMMLVFTYNDLEKTGLKLFIFNKVKASLIKWTKKEVEDKYLELIDIQYKNRKESIKLDILLEYFILDL